MKLFLYIAAIAMMMISAYGFVANSDSMGDQATDSKQLMNENGHDEAQIDTVLSMQDKITYTTARR